MKNAPPFQMKSRLIFGVSLVLLIAGVYFGGFRKLTEEEGLNSSNLTTVALSEDVPVGFVSQGNQSSPSGTDLVANYSYLYGKYQVKVYANRKFSILTDLEIELLRMEATALDQLYFKMSAEERKKIKRVSFPYAKLEVAGKVIYKKFEDLTPAERESLNC
jgi:hypothetical protein